MKKILIVFAHPAMERSKINKALREAVEGLEGVTFNDLYAKYPDFIIDVKAEQKLCEEHDIIICQHPLYWYAPPAILKEWLDLVLEYGWAYGSKGKQLKGKIFFQAITGGGDDSTYREDGANLATIKELISPYRAMANLCCMEWLPPFTVLGVHRELPVEKLNMYVEDYRRALIALRDGMFDMEQAQNVKYINSDMDSVIRRAD